MSGRSGNANQIQTEEFNLAMNPPEACASTFPTLNAIAGQYGGMLPKRKIPLVCGAKLKKPQFCFAANEPTKLISRPPLKRKYPASVALQQENKLWILGGNVFTEKGELKEKTKTSVYILPNGETQPGPDLPYGVVGHCVIQMTSNQFLLTGGSLANWQITSGVWLYDFDLGKWTKENDMTTGRDGHACGTITDDQENIFAIVAGGTPHTCGQVSQRGCRLTGSVELWDPQNKTWTYSESLPAELKNGYGLSVHESREFLFIGGSLDPHWISTGIGSILRFRCQLAPTSCQWTTLPIQLKTPRWGHLAMLIPDNVSSCQQSNILVLSGTGSRTWDKSHIASEEFTATGSNVNDRYCSHNHSQAINSRRGAAGGLVNNVPLICGGRWKSLDFRNCFSTLSAYPVVEMFEYRAYAASVVVKLGNGNAQSLWIAGGYGKERSNLKSTEFINAGPGPGPGSWNVTQGPDLAYPTAGHCLVKISNTKVALTGGRVNKTTKLRNVSSYDFDEKKWSRIPEMKVGRSGHSCGRIKAGKTTYIVVAGGRTDNSVTDTVELWGMDVNDIDSQSWLTAEPLPDPTSGAFGISSNDDKEFLLIGGYNQIKANYKFNGTGEILKLQCQQGITKCQWTKLPFGLEVARGFPIAVKVPDFMSSCIEEKIPGDFQPPAECLLGMTNRYQTHWGNPRLIKVGSYQSWFPQPPSNEIGEKNFRERTVGNAKK